MVNDDTIELLKETNAGIKMAVSSIDDCMKYVEDSNLEKILNQSKQDHEKYGNQTHSLLTKYQDEDKEPNAMAKTMAKVKTTFSCAINEHTHNQTVADLITDGCNMGVKSLYKYMNKYKAADEESKNIAKDVCSLEEDLAMQLRSYL